MGRRHVLPVGSAVELCLVVWVHVVCDWLFVVNFVLFVICVTLPACLLEPHATVLLPRHLVFLT